MAKKSSIARNERRKALVEQHAARRAVLKAAIASVHSTPEQREEAVRALARMPRDASPVRVRNRDAVDGRPRGHLRKAGISRVRFRTMAHAGELPGIVKSSW